MPKISAVNVTERSKRRKKTGRNRHPDSSDSEQDDEVEHVSVSFAEMSLEKRLQVIDDKQEEFIGVMKDALEDLTSMEAGNNEDREVRDCWDVLSFAFEEWKSRTS